MVSKDENISVTDKVQQLLEKSLFFYHLLKFEDARSSCLEAIQICSNNLLNGNKLKKLNQNETQLIELVMELFSQLKSEQNSSNISIKEKLKWLSSKINNEFFSPLIVSGRCSTPFTFVDIYDKCFNDNFNYEISLNFKVIAQNKEVEWRHSCDQLDGKWDLSDPGLKLLYQSNNMSTCSFLASMISIMNYNPEILSKIIHPFGINTYKYLICLFVNGCQRVVRINDKLPFMACSSLNSNKSGLYIKSYSNDAIVWPALIEKAYLKLVGSNSYEFEGSNSGFDTYLLTGWIPQYLKTNHVTKKDDFWDLIYTNFKPNITKNKNVQNLLINAGTGSSSFNTIIDGNNSIFLAANHDFSIIDLKVTETDKFLLIRNPWYLEKNREFWINLDKFLKCFETIYLNWNPEFFQLNSFDKFIGTVGFEISPNSDVMDKPQYTIENSSNYEQKVFLFINEDIKYFQEKKQNSNIHNSNDYTMITKVTIILSDQGQRFISYSGSNQILASIETKNALFSKFVVIPPKKTITVIVETKLNSYSFDGKGNNKMEKDVMVVYNFNCYSFSKNSIGLKKSKFDCCKVEKIIDKWNMKNSGGNWLYTDYINNPQYVLEFLGHEYGECEFANIFLFVKNLEVLFNLQIFWYPGKYGIQSFDSKKIIYNEKYKGDGEVVIENLKLHRNRKYILLLSTYLPLSELTIDECEYKLIVQSQCKDFLLQKLNNINKKLFNRSLEFHWNNLNRKELQLKLSRGSTVDIRAFSSDDYDTKEKSMHGEPFNNKNFKRSLDCYRPKIRINIVDSKYIVYKQENFDDNLYGLFINDLQLDGEAEYLVILERFESGTGDLILQIGCDTNFEVSSIE